jgi:hypothetical protein
MAVAHARASRDSASSEAKTKEGDDTLDVIDDCP